MATPQPETTDDLQADVGPPAPEGSPQLIQLTGGGSFTQHPVENPQFTQKFAESQAANQEATKAGEAEAPLTGAVKAKESEGKSKAARENERQAEERRQFGEAYDFKRAETERLKSIPVDEAAKLRDKLDAAASNAKYHDWWDSKSSGDRIKAHIAIGLGAFGNALAGGGNPALEMIQREIDRDERIQKEGIDRKYTEARMAAERLKGTQEERERALLNVEKERAAADVALTHRQMNQLKAIEDESLSQQLAAGVPLAQAHQNTVNKAATAARTEKEASLAQKLNGMRQISKNEHQTVEKTPSKPPAILTDTLTGKDLPVDPRRTDARKHNAAVALLPNANGAIQILDSVLAKTKTGAEAPGILKFLPGKAGESAQKQTGVASEMTRFRSAYAAAKKESVGEKNAEELAKAIPDPPSALSGPGAFAAWRRQIEDTRKELYDIRNGLMGNAGVPPQYLHHSEAAKPGGGITRPEMIESVKGAVSGARKLSPAELAGGSFVK